MRGKFSDTCYNDIAFILVIWRLYGDFLKPFECRVTNLHRLTSHTVRRVAPQQRDGTLTTD